MIASSRSERYKVTAIRWRSTALDVAAMAVVAGTDAVLSLLPDERDRAEVVRRADALRQEVARLTRETAR